MKSTPGVDFSYDFRLATFIEIALSNVAVRPTQSSPNFCATNSCEKLRRIANRSNVTIKKSTPGVDFSYDFCLATFIEVALSNVAVRPTQSSPNFCATNSCKKLQRIANRSNVAIKKSTSGFKIDLGCNFNELYLEVEKAVYELMDCLQQTLLFDKGNLYTGGRCTTTCEVVNQLSDNLF